MFDRKDQHIETSNEGQFSWEKGLLLLIFINTLYLFKSTASACPSTDKLYRSKCNVFGQRPRLRCLSTDLSCICCRICLGLLHFIERLPDASSPVRTHEKRPRRMANGGATRVGKRTRLQDKSRNSGRKTSLTRSTSLVNSLGFGRREIQSAQEPAI